MGSKWEIGFELRISCSDTMINYRFSQKFKLLVNGEFNHLTIILTMRNVCKLKVCSLDIFVLVFLFYHFRSLQIFWLLFKFLCFQLLSGNFY